MGIDQVPAHERQLILSLRDSSIEQMINQIRPYLDRRKKIANSLHLLDVSSKEFNDCIIHIRQYEHTIKTVLGFMPEQQKP